MKRVSVLPNPSIPLGQSLQAEVARGLEADIAEKVAVGLDGIPTQN